MVPIIEQFGALAQFKMGFRLAYHKANSMTQPNPHKDLKNFLLVGHVLLNILTRVDKTCWLDAATWRPNVDIALTNKVASGIVLSLGTLFYNLWHQILTGDGTITIKLRPIY